MVANFQLYFQLGFQHIADWAALDHLLFLGVLCAAYTWQHWRQVAWLVTAFTLGHCLTLLLAATDTLRLPTNWVEVLIPATIVATALFQLIRQSEHSKWSYGLALGFGLVHGLGFANTFRAMLFPDERDQIFQQLLGFNIGVEVAQLLVVSLILSLAYVAIHFFRLSPKWWLWALSAIGGLAGLWMTGERLLAL